MPLKKWDDFQSAQTKFQNQLLNFMLKEKEFEEQTDFLFKEAKSKLKIQ